MQKSHSNRKLLIIIGSIASTIAIILIVILVIILKSNTIDDSYFISDNSKYVFEIPSDSVSFDSEDEAYRPVKAYNVYHYSGNKITSLETIYQYSDNDTARNALEHFTSDSEGYKLITQKGNYIILTADESTYSDLSPDTLQNNLDFESVFEDDDIDIEPEDDAVDEIDAEDYPVELDPETRRQQIDLYLQYPTVK